MKYFSVEFHGVGLEYIEEFEDLFKSHGQGFNAIKSRVKKEQISPKLFSNQFISYTYNLYLNSYFLHILPFFAFAKVPPLLFCLYCTFAKVPPLIFLPVSHLCKGGFR